MSEATYKIVNGIDKHWTNKNGLTHRDGAPAVECRNGTKLWYRNGQKHRVGGPAIECANGIKQWYQNGKLHRIDGPAIEDPQSGKMFYARGYYCHTFKEFFNAIPKENREAALLLIAEFENV